MKKYLAVLVVSLCSIMNTSAQEVVSLNLDTSVVHWSASYSFEFGGHDGMVKFQKADIIKTNGKITGGSFLVDMSTIANMDGSSNDGFIKHVKDPDFFDVEKFPTAGLVITNVKYHNRNNTPNNNSTFLRMDANLTIKGITLPITFESEINAENTEMVSKFKIDRTRWKIYYGAKGFGTQMKERFISDAIEFEVILRK